MSEKICPCCPRGCDLENPHCGRGAEYAKTGVVPTAPHGHGDKKQFDGKKHYHALDDDNKLIWNIRDLGHIVRALYEGKGSQSRILIMLNETDSITQRELTERIGVKPGSASEVIGKLENAGLITRTPSENDRRTADICLTDEGRAKAEEASAQRKQRHTEMFSCLNDEEKQNLLALLEKLNADWRHRYEDFSIKGGPHGEHHGGPHGEHHGGPHGEHHGEHHGGPHGEHHGGPHGEHHGGPHGKHHGGPHGKHHGKLADENGGDQ